MFVFASYVDIKNKYLDAQQQFDGILKEKESLFAKTQPKSPKWDKVGGHSNINSFDEYLAVKEKARIDERIKEIKSILKDRERLLILKEHELFNSNHVIDQVYKMKYIEKHNVPYIISTLHFSKSQIYRILESIKTELHY